VKQSTFVLLAALALLALVGCQGPWAASPASSTPGGASSPSVSPSSTGASASASPDATGGDTGARILFQRTTPDGGTYLDLVTVGTGEVVRFPDQGHHLYANDVAWSPDGVLLIGPLDMELAGGHISRLLATFAIDGHDPPRQITHPPDDVVSNAGTCAEPGAPSVEPGASSSGSGVVCASVSDRDAAWSPDGQRVAFTRSIEPESHWVVGVAAVDGEESERIVADGFGPVWSPDGRSLAYQVYQPSGRGAPGEGVTILDLESGETHLVWPGFADRLAWTAEGILVTTSGWPDCGPMCLISPDDGSIRRLDMPTADPPVTKAVDFDGHPDGHTAVLTLAREQDLDLWVIDLRTGDWKPLTDTPDLERGAVWSPDGRQIAFARAPIDTLRPSIWVMNADGSGARRVAEPLAEGGDDLPSWQPVAVPVDLPVDTEPPTPSPPPSPSTGHVVLVVTHPEGIGRVEGSARCDPRGDGGTDIYASDLGPPSASVGLRIADDGSLGFLDVAARGVSWMSGKGWELSSDRVTVAAGSAASAGSLTFQDLPDAMGGGVMASGELSWSCPS
jgi:WD40 repeat protein